MPVSSQLRPRMLAQLRTLYGTNASTVLRRVETLIDRHAERPKKNRGPLWDERTAVLITYGDQVRDDGRPSLQVLDEFLHEYRLRTTIDTVHVLPFFPYSSDDGFAVIDYRRVDPALGTWEDIDGLGQSFDLMFDFVLNHCAQEHAWFQSYRRGEAPYRNYFIQVDPRIDLSAVTRPRSAPLLTPVETTAGVRYVWTTFSADQIDLNFANPDVLIEMFDILLFYLDHGARIIRLDAIGFLWKTIGTSCMHLPETHAVVKLMRQVVDAVAPGTILLTETNVPHEENVGYFGAGDEAHAVYQFSLAPLLLDAFLTGDATPLKGWLANLESVGTGMTFLNFTASHDGIGLRPLEGLVPATRYEYLIEAVRQRGGLLSSRRAADGKISPYELNISYFSALGEPGGLPPTQHAARFLTSQGVMLALRGIPAVYFHSLLATPNDTDAVRQTGRYRSINRHKFTRGELNQILADRNAAPRMVFDGYRHMLAVRRRQAAFHPDAAQAVVGPVPKSVVAFTRTSLDGRQSILVLANLGPYPVDVNVASLVDHPRKRDLLSGQLVAGATYRIEAYTIAWLDGAT